MKTIQTNQINTHKGDGLSAKTLASYNFWRVPLANLWLCKRAKLKYWSHFLKAFFFCKSAIYSLPFTITLSKRQNTIPYVAPPRLNLKSIRPCMINLGILNKHTRGTCGAIFRFSAAVASCRRASLSGHYCGGRGGGWVITQLIRTDVYQVILSPSPRGGTRQWTEGRKIVIW